MIAPTLGNRGDRSVLEDLWSIRVGKALAQVDGAHLCGQHGHLAEDGGGMKTHARYEAIHVPTLRPLKVFAWQVV